MRSLSKFGSMMLRILSVVTLLSGTGFAGAVVLGASVSTSASAAVVRSISVRGNQRVDPSTIRSYMTIEPGRSFSSFDTDESLRQLFATGLFSDVDISQSGNTLVVTVKENPTVNLVLFEGNDKVRDDQLKSATQLQSLSVFSQDKLESDRDRVERIVRRSGRGASQVTSRVDTLENNRVNVVFVINEGGRTKIDNIEFIGNNAFGDRRLMEVISHNESNLLSWLKRDDLFDQDRLRADEERLRQFYYNHGYADFRVISADAQHDEANNSYSISISVEEGDRYSFGTVDVDNALSVVTTEELQKHLKVVSGESYSARNVEKTLVALTDYIAGTGYAFAEVTPRGDRDFENRTINISFFVDEGPRVYVERIEVQGNSRTRGYVIRREFDVSEGDAYNKVLVNRTKRRLEALGFFTAVRITTRPGSSPDRVVLVVDVVDKPTGELSFGGGYSSANGAIGEISLQEKNFLGRGQYLKISGGFGTNSTKYQVSFTEPYFLGHRIAAGFDVSHDTVNGTDNTLYDSTTTLGRLRASAYISDNLSLGVNYTFKREVLKVEDGTALASLSLATQDSINRSPYTTSSVGYSLNYSTLDNYKNPREGLKLKLSQDFAGLGGDAQFIRTKARATAYFLASEDSDIVLLGSIGAGNVTGWGGDLRIVDHFFQGGETIRGFASRGLGPRDTGTGEALGGQTFANITGEIQFPIPIFPRSFGLRGALFAEAGTLYGTDDFGSATIKDDTTIRASVGASIIWDSPFGPLRGDFSHVLAKESYDKTEFFRFGVSTKF